MATPDVLFHANALRLSISVSETRKREREEQGTQGTMTALVPTENHRGQGRVSDICTNLSYPDILPEACVQAVSSTKTVEKNEDLLRLPHSHASHPVWKKMQLWPYVLYPTEP
ncbi:unnamed protein product [Porites evermanni]|uniref:Uncharacterized protein n=1 Tax=Porites evermanni TaxID=104178 RepID=A0ABN8MJE1_9CNID|nr:unnamed protein product [Porites evermanni]